MSAPHLESSGRRITVRRVAHDPDGVNIDWQDASQSRYPTFWLRDNVPDGRHQADGQRLLDIIDVDDDIRIEAADLTDRHTLRVRFEPEGLETEFALEWLRETDRVAAAEARRTRPALWDNGLAAHARWVSYPELRRDEDTLRAWLAALRDLGFALVKDVPTRPGQVLEVAGLFGFVRETNYGPLFDVVHEPQPDNLAFTRLALGLHTDNPYRDPVPGLQLLHCLDASADGGESLVADGFRAAYALRDTHPDEFALLTRHSIAFRYASADTDLRARAPLIQVDEHDRVIAVRYNHRSMEPIALPRSLLPDFYRAYRRFGRALHDEAGLICFKLAPGDLFVVDNQRVLHGRRGFAGTRRHLQGCYADKDALLSRLRVLERHAAAP